MPSRHGPSGRSIDDGGLFSGPARTWSREANVVWHGRWHASRRSSAVLASRTWRPWAPRLDYAVSGRDVPTPPCRGRDYPVAQMRPPSLCFAPQFGWSSVAAILPASRQTVGCPADRYASPRLTCSARSALDVGAARCARRCWTDAGLTTSRALRWQLWSPTTWCCGMSCKGFSYSLGSTTGSSRGGAPMERTVRHLLIALSSMGPRGSRELVRFGVCAAPQVKFFFWLALRKRLWTAELRWRHGLQQHADCLLCGQDDETCDHLLAACVFTWEIWYRILITVGLQHTAPSPSDTLVDWWLAARKQVPGALSRGFDSLVLLVSWELWKERNRRTFDRVCATTTHVLRQIQTEGESWIAAGFSKLTPLFALASA